MNVKITKHSILNDGSSNNLVHGQNTASLKLVSLVFLFICTMSIVLNACNPLSVQDLFLINGCLHTFYQICIMPEICNWESV